MSPPKGGPWDCSGEANTSIYMPDSLTVQVPIRQDYLVVDVLSVACKVRRTMG